MSESLKGGFKNPGVEFRAASFWSWNDDLKTEELKRQMRKMREGGLGGFFMHSRPGRVTPYLSGEWMALIKETVEHAKKK